VYDTRCRPSLGADEWRWKPVLF